MPRRPSSGCPASVPCPSGARQAPHPGGLIVPRCLARHRERRARHSSGLRRNPSYEPDRAPRHHCSRQRAVSSNRNERGPATSARCPHRRAPGPAASIGAHGRVTPRPAACCAATACALPTVRQAKRVDFLDRQTCPVFLVRIARCGTRTVPHDRVPATRTPLAGGAANAAASLPASSSLFCCSRQALQPVRRRTCVSQLHMHRVVSRALPKSDFKAIQA